MLRLGPNVIDNIIKLRARIGKRPIPALPFETAGQQLMLIEPFAGIPFYQLDQLGDGLVRMQTDE